MLELMKYKVVSTKDTGRVTQMMLKINKVSHVQTFERSCSGDERTDIGCLFPLREKLSPGNASFCSSVLLLLFVLKEKPNAGGREQKFGQIHCTVTYFIVPFLEGNKTITLLLFVSFVALNK